MASPAPIQPHGSLQLNPNSRNSSSTWCTSKSLIFSAYMSLRCQPQHLVYYGSRSDNLRRNKPVCRFIPLIYSWRRPSSTVSSAIPSDCDSGICTIPLDLYHDIQTYPNYIDYLMNILHEFARHISVGLKNHESSRIYPKLAKAWVGIDADAWQGRVAYQAAVYALLKAVLVIGDPFDNIDPVFTILSAKIQQLLDSLDGELSKRDPDMVNWFRMEQLPALTKCVTLALDRPVLQYVTSGSAVISFAISCCVAIKRINASRISCPAFRMPLPDTIWELVELAPEFSSLERVHYLAATSGAEHEFLTYFGPKVLHHDARGDIIFWMTLLQEKLVAALCRESVVTILQLFCRSEVVAKDLAVIGLLAFLGRKTRLFLGKMGINDLDEPVKDFICYLECGIIFLYPELSSICAYQMFMDVVTEEIAWLDFYATESSTNHQDRKRLKHHTIQAEKEIILSTVFGVCLDMFSSFAHYSEKTKQSPNPNLQAYLNVSKCLLTFCLEDYWAAFDRLRELGKITQIQFPEPVMHTEILPMAIPSFPWKQSCARNLKLKSNVSYDCTSEKHKGKLGCSDRILETLPEASETKPHQSFFAKSSSSFLSTASDIYMGTQLLFLDFKVTVGFIQKRIFGQALTERERKKFARTAVDVLCVIPITILMLLPVTAIGHAAMLTAIKRYIPDLIPSPYSKQRLDVIKQLKRAKKMKVESCSNTNAVSLAF